MLQRAVLGTSLGGGLGALYGVFGRCKGGICMIEWNATVPTVMGAAVGLLIVLMSRWD